MGRVKLVGTLILALSALVLAVQNTAPVEATLLVKRVSTPLTVIVIISMTLGFALGVLVSIRTTRGGK